MYTEPFVVGHVAPDGETDCVGEEALEADIVLPCVSNSELLAAVFDGVLGFRLVELKDTVSDGRDARELEAVLLVVDPLATGLGIL